MFIPLIVVGVFVGCGLYVHFRGNVRHKLVRQISSQSTVLSPLNCFFYGFSAVPNRPWLDRTTFPELGLLEENWQTVRDEALALSDGGSIRCSEHYDDLGFNSFFRRGWKRFYLKWYGEALPSAKSLCPKTLSLVERIPCVKAAMFALMSPRSKLMPHRDPFAGALRYHLALVTPKVGNCWLELDGERYVWREGEGVLFDPTFIHHAANETDEPRIILFCDIVRPMRNRFASAVSGLFVRKIMRTTATKNVDGEKIGLLNRAFGYVYPLRKLAKTFKSKVSKPCYYTLKFTLLAGLVLLMFWVFAQW